MLRPDQKKAQAATELAIFGAILIFLLGTIIRTAVGSSYIQNQDFKAMRMALLASWNDSRANPGMGARQVTAHNNAQVLFLEDRLSPDYNKYGDMDRTPFIASGSGTFSFNLLYPISDSTDIVNSLPVQDAWINGQHFPFSLASYVGDRQLVRPTLGECNGYLTKGNACKANQCYRNYREWSGGLVRETAFISSAVAPFLPITGECSKQNPGEPQRSCQQDNNACTVFSGLYQAGIIDLSPGVSLDAGNCSAATGTIDPSAQPFLSSLLALNESTQGQNFMFNPTYGYENKFPGLTPKLYEDYLTAIYNILHPIYQYKLFYTIVPNPGSNAPVSASGVAEAQFSTTAPTCGSHPCMYNELSTDVPLLDYYGNPTTDGNGNVTNVNGVMQYDLLRMGYYSSGGLTLPPCASNVTQPCQPVSAIFPLPNPPNACTQCFRNYVAWQWAATAGTSAAMIGLNTSNEQFPTFDIDGRLKQVIIYKISQDAANATHVAYEDTQGGDLDQTWDANTCGPKPGLQQTQMEGFTFTQNGTYLLIKEGKLFNPETGQVVRSANKRDNVELIQRSIQLSNNTGRFCTPNPAGKYAGPVPDGTTPTYKCDPNLPLNQDCANPNPVEVCVNENPCNCFMGGSASNPSTSACGMTLAETCYDTLQNVIYIRSRLQDLNGRSWMTNTAGGLKVQ